MTHLTRREFLKLTGVAAAGLALLETGCSSSSGTNSTAVSGRQAIAPTGNQAYVAVAHGGDPAGIVKAALASLGGMERFVKQGQNVIIKPNICVDYHPPEYAATSNPIVVATLVALCLGAGAKRVRVMDSPFAGISATSAYSASGIEEAVKAAGGEMEVMSPIKFAKFDIPAGKIHHLRRDLPGCTRDGCFNRRADCQTTFTGAPYPGWQEPARRRFRPQPDSTVTLANG